MLAFIQRDTAREHNRLFVSGVVYVAIMAALIALCTAMYQKAFQRVTTVTVEAERAGLQLPQFGDVRMHGVLIGQVREITQHDGKAMIRLGLDPDAAKAVPTNARVQIRPTTLFGQKYVEFVDPEQAGGTGLDDGTVIASHRVDTSVELELILTRLSSILTAVQPQDLNATLNAVATALSGNGDDIGDAMEKLDSYLEVMNPHLPKLKRDLTRLADVAETYDMAAPDLLDALENATTTARTVSAKKSDLSDSLEGLTKVARSGRGLLRENERAILIEGKLAVPLLNLLAFYSPEYQCLFGGMDKSIPALDGIFRNSRVNQTMSFGGTQRPAYQVKDRPEWNGTWRGPSCLGLPGNPIIGRPQMLDGTEDIPFQYFRQAPDNPPKYFFQTVGAD